MEAYIDNRDYSIKNIGAYLDNGMFLINESNTWDNDKKSYFIESILMGLPMLNFWTYEMMDGMCHILDGQKRLLTIREFINGKFALSNLSYLKELEGKTANEIHPKYVRTIKYTHIVFNNIRSNTPKDIAIDIAKRIGANVSRVENW